MAGAACAGLVLAVGAALAVGDLVAQVVGGASVPGGQGSRRGGAGGPRPSSSPEERQIAEDAELARVLQEEERRRAGGVFVVRQPYRGLMGDGGGGGAGGVGAGPRRHRAGHDLAEMVSELREIQLGGLFGEGVPQGQRGELSSRFAALRMMESLGALMELRDGGRGPGGRPVLMVGGGDWGRRGLELLGGNFMGDLMGGDFTYEELLDLEERMGGPVNRGASAAAIAALPEVSHRREGAADCATSADAESCSVCLDDYNEGDKLRVLPCGHRFHSSCIDRWLESNRACPICKKDIC